MVKMEDGDRFASETAGLDSSTILELRNLMDNCALMQERKSILVTLSRLSRNLLRVLLLKQKTPAFFLRLADVIKRGVLKLRNFESAISRFALEAGSRSRFRV
jgi:hypothetical protein